MKCLNCDGDGYIVEEGIDLMFMPTSERKTCRKCNGKGYIKEKESISDITLKTAEEKHINLLLKCKIIDDLVCFGYEFTSFDEMTRLDYFKTIYDSFYSVKDKIEYISKSKKYVNGDDFSDYAKLLLVLKF